MAPRSALPRSSRLSSAVFVASLLVALGACSRDAPPAPKAPDEAGPAVSIVPVGGEAPPSLDQPRIPPLLATVDRAGTLRVLDAAGSVLATCAGRATDVVSTGATIATFEPANGEEAGKIRIFTLSGSTLEEASPRSITSETGGLVEIIPGTDVVVAWEEAERASLCLVTAEGSGGVGSGSPASIRRSSLADGSASFEVLVTASGAPRIDRFRLDQSGQLRPEDDFAVPLPADVEARMVPAPDGRLLVTVEAGALRLRDEAGGEETGPAVAPKATLEDTQADGGRLALLLRSPATLVQRDLDGVYTTRALPEPLAWDPRPSHRLVVEAEATFVIAGTGLLRVASTAPDEEHTTADGAPELLLPDAVAVVSFRPE